MEPVQAGARQLDQRLHRSLDVAASGEQPDAPGDERCVATPTTSRRTARPVPADRHASSQGQALALVDPREFLEFPLGVPGKFTAHRLDEGPRASRWLLTEASSPRAIDTAPATTTSAVTTGPTAGVAPATARASRRGPRRWLVAAVWVGTAGGVATWTRQRARRSG